MANRTLKYNVNGFGDAISDTVVSEDYPKATVRDISGRTKDVTTSGPTFTWTIDGNGGSDASVSGTRKDVTRYTALGSWSGGGKTFIAGREYSDLYSKIGQSSLTVTVAQNDGSVISYKYEDKTLPSVTRKSSDAYDYSLSGYKDSDGNEYSAGKSYTISSNKTLTAQWNATIRKYKLTYSSGGAVTEGTIPSPEDYDYGTTVSLEVPTNLNKLTSQTCTTTFKITPQGSVYSTKTCYNLTRYAWQKWQINGGDTDVVVVKSNITVTPRWSESGTTEYQSITCPDAPEITGWHFDYWYRSDNESIKRKAGESYTPGLGGDVTFIAHYTEMAYVDVSFDHTHINSIDVTYIPHGETEQKTENLTSTKRIYAVDGTGVGTGKDQIYCKTGYHANSGDGAIAKIPASGETAANYTIKDVSANTYSVRYNGNGATHGQGPSPNPVEYTYDDSSKVFPVYGFNRQVSFTFKGNNRGTWDSKTSLVKNSNADKQGWSIGDSLYQPGEAVVNLTSENEKELAANVKWTNATYTIQSTDEPTPSFVYIDIYDFDGFSENKNGSGTRYRVGSTVSTYDNITLYAIWNITQYKIAWNISSDHADQVKNVTGYYYTSKSDKPVTFTAGANGSIMVEYGYEYKITVNTTDDYYATPDTFTSKCKIGGDSYSYEVKPKVIQTRISSSPAAACTVKNNGREFNDKTDFSVAGSTVTLSFSQTVEQKSRFEWWHWADSTYHPLSFDKTYQYPVSATNPVVYARFKGKYYLTVDGGEHGGIAVTFDGHTSTVKKYTFYVDHGQTVELEALPESGYVFVGWRNEEVTTSKRTITVTDDCSYTAIFAKKIDVKAMPVYNSPGVQGEVYITAGGKTYPPDSTGTARCECYDGQQITLAANPIVSSKYRLVRWTCIDMGTTSSFKEITIGTSNTITYTVTENKYLFYAYFGELDYDVYFTKKGEGQVTALKGTQVYEQGYIRGIKPNTNIEFHAQDLPDSNQKFVRWILYNTITKKYSYRNGTQIKSDLNVLTLAIDSDYIITAEFAENGRLKVSVAVVVTGGSGTYDGTLPEYGEMWDVWQAANSPYYDSAGEGGCLGGQCTWFAHGRSAQMRGNVGAAAPRGDGVYQGGWPNAIDWPAAANAAYESGGHWSTGGHVEVGSVALFNSIGGLGHVGVVEKIDGDTVWVSNWNGYNDMALRYLGEACKSMSEFTFINNNTDRVSNVSNEDKEESSDDDNYEISCGAGYVSISGGSTITDATHEYRLGATCSIEAFPADGWVFDGWAHNGDKIEDSLYGFEVDENSAGTYIAMFRNPNSSGGEEPIDPSEVEYICNTYYYLYEKQEGQDYWNYKYEQWLNMGDKNVYDKVEYIESDKTTGQYIDTLYRGNKNVVFEVSGEFTSTDSSQYMGYLSSSESFSFGINSSKQIEFKTVNAAAISGSTYKGTFTVDGSGKCHMGSSYVQTDSNLKTIGTLKLFASGYNGIDNSINTACSFRLTECKIYDNEELVRHFIPVKRRKDNVAGLWETVYKKFYRSAAYTLNEDETRNIKDVVAGPVIAQLNKFEEE